MSSLQNLHDESGHAARLRDVTTLRSTHRSTLVAFPVLECLVPDVNDIEMSRGRWTRKMHRANAILRAVGAGGRNLRSILLRHYREVFRRDPDMTCTFSSSSSHSSRRSIAEARISRCIGKNSYTYLCGGLVWNARHMHLSWRDTFS